MLTLNGALMELEPILMISLLNFGKKILLKTI